MALCCVTKLHILEWPFIVPSTRCTCVMIMLFNQLLDMPHVSGGWIILTKEKCSLTGMETNLRTTFEINWLFVRMEHFWDVLFQLMKHWKYFIFSFSVVLKTEKGSDTHTKHLCTHTKSYKVRLSRKSLNNFRYGNVSPLHEL